MQPFLKWLKDWQDSAAVRVRKESELAKICRVQGELIVLERILGLKEELQSSVRRNLQQQVADNERQRELKQGG